MEPISAALRLDSTETSQLRQAFGVRVRFDQPGNRFMHFFIFRHLVTNENQLLESMSKKEMTQHNNVLVSCITAKTVSLFFFSVNVRINQANENITDYLVNYSFLCERCEKTGLYNVVYARGTKKVFGRMPKTGVPSQSIAIYRSIAGGFMHVCKRVCRNRN